MEEIRREITVMEIENEVKVQYQKRDNQVEERDKKKDVSVMT